MLYHSIKLGIKKLSFFWTVLSSVLWLVKYFYAYFHNTVYVLKPKFFKLDIITVLLHLAVIVGFHHRHPNSLMLLVETLLHLSIMTGYRDRPSGGSIHPQCHALAKSGFPPLLPSILPDRP